MERDEAHRLIAEVEGHNATAIMDKLREAGYLEKREKQEPDDPARFDVPDVEHLTFALIEAGGKLRPVSAKEIALVLWDGEHGHGDMVKVGQRLGMMASVGLVERHRNPHNEHQGCRWTLVKKTS